MSNQIRFCRLSCYWCRCQRCWPDLSCFAWHAYHSSYIIHDPDCAWRCMLRECWRRPSALCSSRSERRCRCIQLAAQTLECMPAARSACLILSLSGAVCIAQKIPRCCSPGHTPACMISCCIYASKRAAPIAEGFGRPEALAPGSISHSSKLLHNRRCNCEASRDCHRVCMLQVVSFRLPTLHPNLPALRNKLNTAMPQDVRIAHLQHVPPDFNARYSPLCKQYIFSLQTGPVLDPLSRAYAQHVPDTLDISAMR